jgi:hypothetical protein
VNASMCSCERFLLHSLRSQSLSYSASLLNRGDLAAVGRGVEAGISVRNGRER